MPISSKSINLSYASIFRVVLVSLGLLIAYLIRDALALLFIAVIFAAAVDPLVDWLQKRRLPRAVSILMIYVVLIAIFSLVIVMMIPPVTEQIGQIISHFPAYYEKVSLGIHSLQEKAVTGQVAVGNDSLINALESLSLTLAQTTKSIFVTITSIFGGLMSLLIVLVITFYLTVEEHALKKFIEFLLPGKHREYAMDLIERMQYKVGMWLRGQLLLSVIVGALTYIGLSILGVKYALLLALIAGILEIVPYLGPLLSAIPAVVVAFSDSPLKLLLVIVLYLVIQQAENNIIVPKLMSKMVGLNPIVVIMAILIGMKLGGVIGALLGVPVAAAIGVYFADYVREKEKVKEAANQ